MTIEFEEELFLDMLSCFKALGGKNEDVLPILGRRFKDGESFESAVKEVCDMLGRSTDEFMALIKAKGPGWEFLDSIDRMTP